MVVRPSLKRVVPGSVNPPWRALCAESAPALKAFFKVLCVSKSVLLLESKFPIARAKLGQTLVPARGPRALNGAPPASVALAVARPRVNPGSFP